MRFLVCLLLLGCAHDVRAVFPVAPDAPTGTLVLRLSRPADHVTVAVNGQLLVEDVRTQRITIEQLPVGTVEVILSANGGDKQLRVWIDDTHVTTVPLGVPEQGVGFAKTILGTLISLVAYSLLH